ncbi:phage tail protein [Brevundimonas sp. UBA7664]|uniref:phage tail protein n=1 Tax=Brevundimonas sp. UBA7664 TaxID=1946141 RepID=UPI0025BA0C64|nr:phage tail protein [Brevundimonas sp. UBA7664]
MLKPDSVRAFLTAAIPALKAEPDRLQIYIDKGSIRATGVPGASGVMGFEYRYTCTLMLLDFAVHPDAVMTPLVAWVAVNEPELLQNYDKNREGLAFEADILDARKIDLQISLPLTERVIATPVDGGFNMVHAAEPAQAGVESWPAGPASPPVIHSIYADGELIAEIPAP